METKPAIDFSPGSKVREMINYQFTSDSNKSFYDWYSKYFTSYHKDISEIFYKNLSNKNQIQFFVDWFISWFPNQQQITFPISIQVLTKEDFSKNWIKPDRTTIRSEHPPLGTSSYRTEDTNQRIELNCQVFTPAEVDRNAKMSDLFPILRQNNFANTNLVTLSRQTSRIESHLFTISEQIDKIGSVPAPKVEPAKASLDQSVFKPSTENPTFQVTEPTRELADLITKKLQDLRIQPLKPVETLFYSSSEERDAESYISNLENQFSINHIEKGNDFSLQHMFEVPVTGKTYYKRHTPMDILIEDEGFNPDQARYSSHTIYEWNIDGRSDYQTLMVLHRMMMYTNVLKSEHNSDHACARFITHGFSGILKGWWDNILSQQQRDEIFNATKQVQTVNPPPEGSSAAPTIVTTVTEDAVFTLLLTIMKHFVADYSTHYEKTRELLQHLRCKTLTEFKWYKDVFLAKVTQLADANQNYWKAKFIDGLPALFAEKVRQRLRDQHDGHTIPYDHLTYGDIISTCTQTGISLCNDLKLQYQLKQQNLTGRRELGEFCDQFAIDVPRSSKHPKRYKHRKDPTSKKYRSYRRRKNKNYSQPKERYYSKPRKGKRTSKSQRKKALSEVKCFSCGKFGHYASKCSTKKKLNELNIDEGLKLQLSKLLLNSESEPYTSSESSSDELNEMEFISSSSSSDSENPCPCDKQPSHIKALALSNGLKLNVLTSAEQSLLEIANDIADPEKKTRYLEAILSLIKHTSASSTSENTQKNITPKVKDSPYTMRELFQRRESQDSFRPVTTKDLHREINTLKNEISELKVTNQAVKIEISHLQNRLYSLENKGKDIMTEEILEQAKDKNLLLNLIREVTYQKWFIRVNIVIKQQFTLTQVVALVDSGADMNCIQEGLVPTRFFEKTVHSLASASGADMKIKYKLSDTYICNQGICLHSSFLLVKNLQQQVILGTPFLDLIMPIYKVDQTGIYSNIQGQEIVFEFITDPETKILSNLKDFLQNKENQLNFLKDELRYLSVEQSLQQPKMISVQKEIEANFISEICSDHPNAFWERKRHTVSLPYEETFDERQIPTKSRPSQMKSDYLETCKKEIQTLLDKKLIRPSYSPWSCTAFYVFNNAEKERGTPRLVINYKPLNDVLRWIRYPIPNKKDLLDRLQSAVIFSKFDMKSGYWQIQVEEKDRYKTAFVVPFGHYEWNVMPFGLKNAPSEYQNIMNDIFNPYSNFCIVYIDDVLVFSESIDQHLKHLRIFKDVIKKNGLVVSAPKMKLFQTKVRFLGHNIHQGTIIPIDRSIEFASKFPDEIKDKTQLQRFLGGLNYIADYYPKLAQDSAILYTRLTKNPPPWTSEHTKAIQKIKIKVKQLPCLCLSHPQWKKIVETDASDIGYGGILKQLNPNTQKEELVRFTSGVWKTAQKNYSTIKKEILAIVKCISKFQDDLLNQTFLLRVDCSAAKQVLKKDVKNLVSKQIFARWQSELSSFDFSIEYIKGSSNSLPDFLTREFLQNATPEEGL